MMYNMSIQYTSFRYCEIIALNNVINEFYAVNSLTLFQTLFCANDVIPIYVLVTPERSDSYPPREVSSSIGNNYLSIK